jgi:hypothetical protein
MNTQSPANPWPVAVDALVDRWREEFNTEGPQEAQEMLHILLNQVALTLSHDTIPRDDALELVGTYLDGWPKKELPHKRFVAGDWAIWTDPEYAAVNP